ncbi:MAG: amidohydrolase family protein [Planctomycetes bacterium]|nr:amidohydrolase family protein [Planctomycetota bacterium]
MSDARGPTGARAHRAALLWLGPDRVLAPGELVVGPHGRVLACRAIRARRVPPVAIVPGLVDAHVHLQIAPLERAERRFLPWLRAILRRRAGTEPGALAARTARSLEALLASGCTAVGEIDSAGSSPPLLRSFRLAGRCFQEVLGFDLGPRAAAIRVAERRLPGTRRCPAGLSPHAPYSVSDALFKAARRSGMPLQVHLAESEEEVEFVRRGRGPFRDLLAELGRLPEGYRAPASSPSAHLERLGLLCPTTSLVHAQHLERGDAERIAAHGAAIVVCPGTIQWFRRAAPPVPAWLELGIPVALGTDSPASCAAFSMVAQMRAARRLWPTLAPATILAMATRNGGQALARPGLGILRPGGAADFVTVPLAQAMAPAAFVDAFTAGELPVARLVLAGRIGWQEGSGRGPIRGRDAAGGSSG